MIYAGFWKRAIAFFIDGLILSVPMVLAFFLIAGSQVFWLVQTMTNTPEPSADIFLSGIIRYMLSILAVNLFNIILLWLYHALMESSKKQATVGKMALGIKVVGANGERISFARATGRFFAKFISHFPFYFGDYMAGFTRHRQALHDLIATTYVVNKNYQEGEPLPALPFSIGGLIAGILAAIAPVVLYVGTVIAAMVFTVSDLKNDPDLQDFWNDLKTENSVPQDPEMAKLINDARRNLYLSSAQVEIDRLSTNGTTLDQPVEKDGIVYSQSAEGYKAAFRDPNGDEYEVLQRPGELLICCLKGPGGKCTDDDSTLYKPCN